MLKLFLQYILDPDGAPQNLTAVNKTSTSILVTWDEVPNDRRHGPILKYEVDYTSTASYVTNSKEVQAPTQYLEIDGLEQNTNYTITVMASTSKGYGPASEPIHVTTDKDQTLSWALCPTFSVEFFEATMKFHLRNNLKPRQQNLVCTFN